MYSEMNNNEGVIVYDKSLVDFKPKYLQFNFLSVKGKGCRKKNHRHTCAKVKKKS